MIEKEEIIEGDDKNGIERDGKDLWKNSLLHRLLWLIREGLTPSSLEKARTAQKRLEKYFC